MPPHVLLVGLSGPSSSGKSVSSTPAAIFLTVQTVSRLLRSIYPRSFIVHQDDFYKDDKDIPVTDGLANWDCAESINWPAFTHVLDHVRECGELPSEFASKEDQNDQQPVVVDREAVQRLQKTHVSMNGSLVVFVDGFLLYGAPEHIDMYDVRLLLRGPYDKLRERRLGRSGYVTLDGKVLQVVKLTAGFWTDPPGYFDKIVWPEYQKSHRQMFVDGNVEGLPVPHCPVQVYPELDAKLDDVVSWCVGIIDKALQDGI